jgi:hypothetical protein
MICQVYSHPIRERYCRLKFPLLSIKEGCHGSPRTAEAFFDLRIRHTDGFRQEDEVAKAESRDGVVGIFNDQTTSP